MIQNDEFLRYQDGLFNSSRPCSSATFTNTNLTSREVAVDDTYVNPEPGSNGRCRVSDRSWSCLTTGTPSPPSRENKRQPHSRNHCSVQGRHITKFREE